VAGAINESDGEEAIKDLLQVLGLIDIKKRLD